MDNLLHQMVKVPTRDKYINDLVLTGNTAIIHNTQVDGQFGSSDYKIITVDIRLFTAPTIGLKGKCTCTLKAIIHHSKKRQITWTG